MLMSPPQSVPDVDAIIAQDLNQMSLGEREQVFFDVHGVSNGVAETEEMIARSLAELDDNLNRIRSKEAYLIAEAQDKEYVSNRKMRLKFLRSMTVCYDPNFTAKKIVRFFEMKRELFGTDKLTKDITLCDLEKEDLACLESGLCHILPLRDRAGRAILSWTIKLRADFSLQSRVSTPLVLGK